MTRSKTYFKLQISRDENTRQPIYTDDFMRNSYVHPDFPNSILVQFTEMKVLHKTTSWKCQIPKKLSRPFNGTLPSVLHSIPSDGVPSNVYLEMIMASNVENLKKQATHAPCDFKQVENSQGNKRKHFNIFHDTFFQLALSS